MFTIELVSFDVGEHAMRQSDHRIVGRALLIVCQKRAIISDQPAALIAQPFDLAILQIPGAGAARVARKRGERMRMDKSSFQLR